MSNIVYVNVLVDSLQKKSSALEKILEFTKEQERLLREEDFDESTFLQVISEKQAYIKRVQELDKGFEAIYKRVQGEFQTGRNQYQAEIMKMQQLIAKITELGIDIETLELRNKAQLEKVLSMRKQKIKERRVSNSAVSNYYRNMASYQMNQSYFLDKKK